MPMGRRRLCSNNDNNVFPTAKILKPPCKQTRILCPRAPPYRIGVSERLYDTLAEEANQDDVQ